MAAVGLQYPSAGQQGAPSVPAPSTLTALAPPQHKRTYQACIPCRRRKVRCDLGSVDNPHDPPCVRCRRESKECYFSATRRKRKPTDGEGSGDGEYEDEFEIRNGRKRLRSGSDGDTPPLVRHRQTSLTAEPKAQPTTYSPLASSFTQPPLTPGGSIGRPQPLRRPRSDPQSAEHSVSHSPQQAFATRVPRPNPYAVHGHPATASADNADDDQHLTNSTAAALIRTEVYSGHDALNLLFEAAGRSGDINHKRIGSHSTVHQSPATVTGTPGSAGAHGQGNGRTNGSDHLSQPRLMGPPRSLPGVTPVDPAIINGEMDSERPDTPGLQSAMKAWAKFRFIRAGWFSAREAIAYIEYFYTYLAPLTPISPPNFHSPATHIALLTEEPILTVTLLTVSSRHMRLPGPSGLSRSYAIHEKLWTYLRGMIERMVWGQEQFGGGLRAAAMEDDGEAQTSSTAPWRGSRKGNLRTLGTVESLMLLTEWHPRALHFPPGDDGDELIVRDEIREHAAQENDGMENDTNKTKGIGGKRLESYLEPAWRSDRMCWMLLGNAMALSFELGVFDDIDDSFPSEVEQHRPEYGQESYRIRAKRVQTLLIIFVTQLAGRLEWNSNMVPQHISNSAFPKIPSPQQHHAGVKRSGIDTREDNHTSSRTAITPLLPNSPIDNAHACWMTIANIMKRGNEMMFRNKKHTRDIIRSGRYVELLNYFQPLLKEWRRSFDALEIPKHMRHILLIEAEYVRMYINSLALQAVVERLTNNTSQDHLNSTASASTGSMSPNSRSLSGNIHPSTLMSLYGNDQEFVKEVVEASRSILTTVVEGLLPDDYLKHCPIRTYFRIISGAMFLLKTFALGAKEDEVAISLGLMDNTVYALRNCVVDDVHLGIRFADLLETLTFRIRARFVRMAASGANNAPNGEESRSPAPPAMRRVSSHHQPPHVDQQHPHQWMPHQSYDMNAVNATNGFNHPMEGRMTPNPLVGISTESIDLTGGNISIMPPPSFGYTPGYENNGAAMHPSDGVYAQNMNDDAAAGYVPDWLALPLDPLLQYGAGVSQTEVGPDVGGYDLLEILLSEMEGSGGGPVGPATGM